MKRVLASLLFLATAMQAATPAPENSAASQPERLVSVAQSPYDFRFYIEQGEWDQVDATLRRIPTNYQFDAYKRNTPLMMVIDLFAQKAADKPKSIWQTAVGGAVKACSGAALVVVGLALALRAKNNISAAQSAAAPKAPRVRFGGVEDVDDAAVSDDEADEKEAAAAPRVRLKQPQYQDQTDAIRQKMEADKKADGHRAQAELHAIDAKRQADAKVEADEQESVNPLKIIKGEAQGIFKPLAQVGHRAVDIVNERMHKIHNDDIKPTVRAVKEAAMNLENRAASVATSVHEAVEDARDTMHKVDQALDDTAKEAKKIARETRATMKEARKTMRQGARDVSKMRQAATQGIEAVSNNVQEGVDLLREQGNTAWLLGTVLGQGIGAAGCWFTGLWAGWKGIKNIRSLISLPQRAQDLNKFRSLITDLLHRKDVNLGIQNSDGETALQMVRRYMAENMDDRENYQLLSEVEQLIMIRQA